MNIPTEFIRWSPMGQEGWNKMSQDDKAEYERMARTALPGAFLPGAFKPKPMEFAMPKIPNELELYAQLTPEERKKLSPSAQAKMKKLIDAAKPTTAPAIPASGHFWM